MFLLCLLGTSKAVAITVPEFWTLAPATENSFFETFIFTDSLRDTNPSVLQLGFLTLPNAKVQELWNKAQSLNKQAWDPSLALARCLQMATDPLALRQTWCQVENRGFLLVLESGANIMRENSRTKLIFEKLEELKSSQ